MIHDYDQLYLQQSVHPFLSSLGPSIELLKELKNKDDSSYLEDLENFRERYLDLLEDELDPIQTFMKGSQFKVYNEVIEYWLQNQDDAKQLESNAIDAIQRLVDSQKPWDDTQAAKSSLEVLRTEIEEKKEKVREEVSILLKEKKGQIQNEPKFTQINEDQKQQILKPLDDLVIKLNEFKSIAAIEAQKQNVNKIFIAQLSELEKLIDDGSDGGGKKIIISSSDIKIDCQIQVISNQDDLDEYAKTLINAYRKVLEENKKIALS